MDEKELLQEIEFLRDENRRLINEQEQSRYYEARANLLDVIIAESYILQSTLDKCIAKLNDIDQLEIKRMLGR